MRFLRLIVMVFLLFVVQPVRAAGVVTDCSTYGPGAGTLQTALSGGGTIIFACSGTIIVPGIDIATDTSIDGSGQNVILSGNNANYVFYVNAPVTVSLAHLTIANGTSDASGGLINYQGDVTLDHVTLTNHNGGSGGAILNSGVLTIRNSTISNNTAVAWGGGISNNYGTLTVIDSTISNNSASSGGGIYNHEGLLTVIDSTIADNTVTGDSASGGGIVTYYAPSVITGSTISGNSGGDWSAAGGIWGWNMTITDSVITGNSSYVGGGIYGTSYTLTNSIVSDNHAEYIGGLYASSAGTRDYPDLGTEVYPDTFITSSLIANNTADDAAGIYAGGKVTITNVTITGNQAESSGGGVDTQQDLKIINSTIVGNSAPEGSGLNAYAGTFELRNTIIADNGTGENCSLDEAVMVSTNSLSDDASCPGSTQTTLANLNLGALTGSPGYFPLLPGSVAINAGSMDFCAEIDQRGVARPQGLGCDVGAYEVESSSLIAPLITAPLDDTVTSNRQPNFTWSAVQGASSYRVQIGDTYPLKTPHITINTPSYIPGELLLAGTYHWRVLAVAGDGRLSPWSETREITITAPFPNGPTLIEPSGEPIRDPLPTFSWTALEGAVSYQFEIRTIYTLEPPLISVPSTSYTPSEIMELDTYYWRVRAVAADGNVSPWSMTREIRIDLPFWPELQSPNQNDTLTDQPTFRWRQTVGTAARYELQVDTVNPPVAMPISVTSAPYRLSAPLPANTYYWRMRTIDAYDRVSHWSSMRQFTILPPPMDTPILIAPANNEFFSDHQPTFTWEPVPGAESYKVDVTGAYPINDVYWGGSVTTTSFTPPEPLAGAKYYWRVRAVGTNFVQSWWSEVRTVTIALDAPALVSPANGYSTTYLGPLFKWGGSPGATRFELQIDTQNPPQTTAYTTSGLQYQPTSVMAVGTYYWRVRGINVSNNIISPWSEIRTITIMPPPAPVLSSPPDGSIVGTTTPWFDWDRVVDAVGYEIQISANNPPSSSPIYVADEYTTAYTQPTHLLAMAYYWRVRSIGYNSVGEWSNIRSIIIDASSSNVVITNFYLTTTPTLTWNRVSWAAGYTVEVDNNADFSSPEFRADTLGSDARSVQTDELTRGRYYWRVCAQINAHTCGKWSRVESFWVEG